MLDVLLSPPILGLIVIALVIVGVIVVFLRRRRSQAQSAAVAPPTDIGGPIDYTSIPYEEPTSLIDRFRNAPPAARILIILVPLVVIAGLIALALAVSSPSQPTAVQPTAPLVGQISITRAEVAGNGKIVVVGATNLPDDAQISAVMKQDEQDFAWFAPDTAQSQPREGKITMTLDRLAQAPVPNRDHEYTIILSANAGGQLVRSAPTKLNVLQPYDADFYQVVAVQPTASPAPPTPTATVASTPVVEPTSAPTEPAPLLATVIGGGKIRKEPSVQADEVGQVTRGETLTLLERTQDGAWYRIQTAAATGWLSSTLLEVTPEIAAKVPTPTPPSGLTTTVFNGGNVRAEPALRGKVLDQINAGETVKLLSRTENNQWFQITNIRGIDGWVNRTLLNLSVELTRQVPVFGTSTTPPVNVTPVAGLTAKVFNGGNVRAEAAIRGKVLDQVNAGETVQLLSKSADGRWYQITTIRKVTGWVSVTLLTIDPDVGRKVPVAK